MAGLALRRLILSIPTIGGIAVVVFIVLLVMPGNPAQLIQGAMATPEVTQALIQKWGLNKPPVERFVQWSNSVLHLDLGTSLVSGRSVLSLLLSRLSYSTYLGIVGMAFGLLLGIPAGIISAVRPNSAADYAVTGIAFAGLSAPVFVAALVFQLVLGFYLRWLPISGAPNSVFSPRMPLYAILPGLSVGLFQAAINARLVRTTMLDVLHRDYVRTARAKGLSGFRTIARHALPNVLIPVVTILGAYVRTVLAGLVLVEVVFSWPGIGWLFYDAVRQRDYPVIQGAALMIAICIYLTNFVVDIAYVYLDPRVRVEGKA
jgi:ABC-type dipeptide/oligopeptide/nickel transport system permease component